MPNLIEAAVALDRNRPARLTRTGVALGSRPHMSPEQWCNAQAVGPTSDVYSLGIVTYEGFALFSSEADN